MFSAATNYLYSNWAYYCNCMIITYFAFLCKSLYEQIIVECYLGFYEGFLRIIFSAASVK